MVLFIQRFVRFEIFQIKSWGNTVLSTVPLTDQQPSPECLSRAHISLRLVLLVFLLFKNHCRKYYWDSVDIAQFFVFFSSSVSLILFCFT